jgi:hypothetical protein
MITGSSGLHARCVRRRALSQPSHGDADDRAPAAVDGPGDRAPVERREALRISELADGILSGSGAQT